MTTCTCGAPFTPTGDGRRRHRTLFDHTPTPATDRTTTPSSDITRECRRGLHFQCGGGVVGGQVCACGCGHEGAWL